MAPHSLQLEIGKKKPFELLEEEAYLNLIRTAHQLSADFSTLFKQYNLSEPAYNILRILRGHGSPGRSCGQIGDQLVARVPDVTRLIDRLESEALVARHRTSEDRRVVLVDITAKGLELLAQLDKPLTEMTRSLFSNLSRADLKLLNHLLVEARHEPSTK